MQKCKETPAPEVGIVYLIGAGLLVESTPLAKAGRWADFAVHERSHILFWGELVKSGRVPDGEYEEYPRGRVAYNTKAGKFTLLADQCILRKKHIIGAILRRMHLSSKSTEIGPDSHYRCFRCLKENG